MLCGKVGTGPKIEIKQLLSIIYGVLPGGNKPLEKWELQRAVRLADIVLSGCDMDARPERRPARWCCSFIVVRGMVEVGCWAQYLGKGLLMNFQDDFNDCLNFQ